MLALSPLDRGNWYWWPEPAVNIEQGLLCCLVLTVLSGTRSVSSCWSGACEIHFCAVFDVWCEIGGIGALPLGEEPLSTPLPELFTTDCTVLSPVTCCAGSQNTLLFALPLTLSQPCECWWSALVSLRHCFHKVISANPQKSGPKTVVVAHLVCSRSFGGGSAQPRHAHAHKSQLQPHKSQLQDYALSIQMSWRH